MPDRDSVINDLVELIEATLAVDSEWVNMPLDLVQYALHLLKEQDEERKRLISWMGKLWAHVDTGFQLMRDEEKTRFMRKQFGWEVSGDDA